MRTFLCEVESVPNKHLPTPINYDIHDFEVITPNHLLIGYQNDGNSFANPRYYIIAFKTIGKPRSPAQICFETVTGNIVYQHYLAVPKGQILNLTFQRTILLESNQKMCYDRIGH